MITDTTGDIFPEGTYQFRVIDIPNEMDLKGYRAWQWSFEAETDQGLRIYNERFMVWLMGPLLKGLGFPEVSRGHFEWEPTDALAREVTANIKHVTLEKGASAGKVVARMVDIKPATLLPTAPAFSSGATKPKKSSVGKAEEDIPF